MTAAVAGDVRYRSSRFNLTAWSGGAAGSGDLLIYNSMSSAFVRLAAPAADRVAGLVATREPVAGADALVAGLVPHGVFVPADFDELSAVESLGSQFKQRRDSLSLILMPTEKCNFRCVYCYEDFVKGKMPDDVRAGVVRLVERELPTLRHLGVDWFGGEPLTALPVVRELSEAMRERCAAAGVAYSSSMTTNGFLLTPPTATECFRLGIDRFQITLDGTAESHDQLRVLRNGRGTFETILTNLRSLRDRTDEFSVRIRVNYTPDVVRRMPDFLAMMGAEFGNDPRFSIWFHPVGKWGGPHDADLETCDEASSSALERQFTEAAADAGFPLTSWRQSMRPFGSACYAADPRSFVIGSDGTVYKCTVALKEEKNLVGRLSPDGELQLRDDRMAVWVSSGSQVDTGCQACGFRPACHGDACPLERLQRGERACPPVKLNIRTVLPLIAVRASAPR